MASSARLLLKGIPGVATLCLEVGRRGVLASASGPLIKEDMENSKASKSDGVNEAFLFPCAVAAGAMETGVVREDVVNPLEAIPLGESFCAGICRTSTLGAIELPFSAACRAPGKGT